MRRAPTDDEGTLSVAYRIDNTGAEPLIILDSFGDPYTAHAPSREETGALTVARLIEGNMGKTVAWVAEPTRRHMATLGVRQTSHDWSLEDDRRLLAAARDAARDLAAAMGDRVGDVRLVGAPDSRFVETDTL